MKSYQIALIPGDGIGQEVVPAARKVLESLVLSFQFIELAAGWATFEQQGTALPDATLDALRSCDGALFGAVSSPSQRVTGYTSPIIAMRKALDLYANLRPILSAPVADSQPDVDLLIVRENTEGLYVKQEHWAVEGEKAVAERVITRQASERIVHMAFKMARQRHEQKPGRAPMVTVVHKSNVLSLTDGLFRESALAVAQEYPDVAVEEQLVDSMIYRMIREPQRYDVVVAPNLYGDILSDGAAALVGGLGLVPSANVGEHFVLAEPVHGSAPDIAGQGMANPVATIHAAALLLNGLGEITAAQQIQGAIEAVLKAGISTPDLGGTATTDDVADAVIEQLR